MNVERVEQLLGEILEVLKSRHQESEVSEEVVEFESEITRRVRSDFSDDTTSFREGGGGNDGAGAMRREAERERRDAENAAAERRKKKLEYQLAIENIIEAFQAIRSRMGTDKYWIWFTKSAQGAGRPLAIRGKPVKGLAVLKEMLKIARDQYICDVQREVALDRKMVRSLLGDKDYISEKVRVWIDEPACGRTRADFEYLSDSNQECEQIENWARDNDVAVG